MSTDNNDICANCGKGEEESGHLKKCGACKSIKYCSAVCQKAHRSQHKKECRKREAELHDEALFTQPPQEEDCPICFLRLPSHQTGKKYNACCGKMICSGCIHALIMTTGKNMCPFCRAFAPTAGEDVVKRVKKRVEVGDARAIRELGCFYSCYYNEGMRGFPRDQVKAVELWHQAAELGCTTAYNDLGFAYDNGEGVERDEKKAKHYWELAAMGGDELARNNLGEFESNEGNMERALKHFMIAVGGGSDPSLKDIKYLYSKGCATKDDYAKALKAYQAYLSEIKSDDRDKAAAYTDRHKYY